MSGDSDESLRMRRHTEAFRVIEAFSTEVSFRSGKQKSVVSVPRACFLSLFKGIRPGRRIRLCAEGYTEIKEKSRDIFGCNALKALVYFKKKKGAFL